ncbi:MAG TPA: hypothetical protein VN806_01570 [Caulobacteraceae bacterium]|jgi:hypothetical protein|nr:hypothetical protein [Caulobacteraceae bacterium]
MIARTAVVIVFLASVGLAACGKLGDLEQPAPMFGGQAKADYDQQRHAADAARARARAASELPPPNDEAASSADPLTQAPFAPTIPGRNDTMPPQGDPGALPQPGQPGAPQ